MSAVLEDATMPGTADFPDPLSLARDLIRFPTVNPPGREKACMEFVGDLLARHGVPVEFYAHDPERPNLVARIRGRGEAPPLLLYGHLDVVSTEGQDWSVPPFEGIVKDGFLWGRGALDMKGGVAMLLSAFLHATRQAPPGDLILALLSDEETGGQYGAAHLVAHHSALFEGVRHAVGEFGAFTLILGGLRFFPIQIAEKRHCKLDLVFRAHGGHASVPPRVTAIGEAAAFIGRLGRAPMPPHISASAREMLRALGAGMRSPIARVLMRALSQPTLVSLALHLLGPRARMFEPLVRSLVTPTVLQGGHKRNVVPEQVTVRCDVRLAPGQCEEAVRRHVARLAGPAASIDIHAEGDAAHAPDLSQFDLLASIVRDIDPDATAVPMLLPGVTDSRHFDKLGIQTYGFLPMVLPEDLNFMSLIHGADERIPTDTLAIGADAIKSFIVRYRG